MKKKQDSFVKIAITALVIAMGLVGLAILYKATNTSGSLELRSKAAEYKEVLVKEWEFKKGTEGWSGVGTIKVDQVDDALRGKLLSPKVNNGQIVNSAVNAKMEQGLKYIKFKLAVRGPVTAKVTPDRPSCPEVMITCANGKQQPAYTSDCRPNRCPVSTQPTSISGAGSREVRWGELLPIEACPQDVKICPDGTKLTRMQTGNGCVFPECPVRRPTPTSEIFNLTVQYMVDNEWASQIVKVQPNESYTEFSVQLPLKGLIVQKIRFIVPGTAIQYTFWFDWIKLWSKAAIPSTPTTTVRPTPTILTSITPSSSLPDLMVDAVNYMSSTNELSIRVCNKGNSVVTRQFNVYMKSDQAPYTWTFSTQNYAANYCNNVLLNCTVMNGVCKWQYVSGQVDMENLIRESNENNNYFRFRLSGTTPTPSPMVRPTCTVPPDCMYPSPGQPACKISLPTGGWICPVGVQAQ